MDPFDYGLTISTISAQCTRMLSACQDPLLFSGDATETKRDIPPSNVSKTWGGMIWRDKDGHWSWYAEILAARWRTGEKSPFRN